MCMLAAVITTQTSLLWVVGEVDVVVIGDCLVVCWLCDFVILIYYLRCLCAAFSVVIGMLTVIMH